MKITITPGLIIRIVGIAVVLYLLVDNYRTRTAFEKHEQKTDSVNAANDKKYRADSILLAGESKHLDSLMNSLNKR